MPFDGIVLTALSLSLAAIGPASAVVEAIATTVGAGILLGGFVAGTLVLFGGGQDARPDMAGAGYIGGLGAIAVLLADWLLSS